MLRFTESLWSLQLCIRFYFVSACACVCVSVYPTITVSIVCGCQATMNTTGVSIAGWEEGSNSLWLRHNIIFSSLAWQQHLHSQKSSLRTRWQRRCHTDVAVSETVSFNRFLYDARLGILSLKGSSLLLLEMPLSYLLTSSSTSRQSLWSPTHHCRHWYHPNNQLFCSSAHPVFSPSSSLLHFSLFPWATCSTDPCRLMLITAFLQRELQLLASIKKKKKKLPSCWGLSWLIAVFDSATCHMGLQCCAVSYQPTRTCLPLEDTSLLGFRWLSENVRVWHRSLATAISVGCACRIEVLDRTDCLCVIPTGSSPWLFSYFGDVTCNFCCCHTANVSFNYLPAQ